MRIAPPAWLIAPSVELSVTELPEMVPSSVRSSRTVKLAALPAVRSPSCPTWFTRVNRIWLPALASSRAAVMMPAFWLIEPRVAFNETALPPPAVMSPPSAKPLLLE